MNRQILFHQKTSIEIGLQVSDLIAQKVLDIAHFLYQWWNVSINFQGNLKRSLRSEVMIFPCIQSKMLGGVCLDLLRISTFGMVSVFFFIIIFCWHSSKRTIVEASAGTMYFILRLSTSTFWRQTCNRWRDMKGRPLYFLAIPCQLWKEGSRRERGCWGDS